MDSTPSRRGIKRSSQLTFRRRLVLVRRLLRSPASGTELIDAVQRELGEYGYQSAAASALKYDLDALKAEYDCRITFQRKHQHYHIEKLGDLALFDMPDECMEAFAFLKASFAEGAIPEHLQINLLLDRVLMLFPRDRQHDPRSQRSTIRLALPGTPSTKVDPEVRTKVKRAIDHRKELCFNYESNHDQQPRRHRVAPYAILLQEGHAYLDATILEAIPPGPEPQRATINYRMDRIIPGSVEILPHMLPPQRPRPQSYTLRYWLSPLVARRRDLAIYFPDTSIDYHDDGSATVTATITNLWQTRQILLRYGPECRVLDPPELIEMFRATVKRMAEMYAVHE